MYNLEDKICAFSVNEFHLAVMLMPYIYESVNENKNIVTFFEKDLEDIYEKVINTNTSYWKDRNKLDSIDWKKLEASRLSEKFENNLNADIVIVAGKKDFIKRINSLVLNFHTNFTLVNCYEVDDFNDGFETIIKEYSKILCTKGIKEIEELYLV